MDFIRNLFKPAYNENVTREENLEIKKNPPDESIKKIYTAFKNQNNEKKLELAGNMRKIIPLYKEVLEKNTTLKKMEKLLNHTVIKAQEKSTVKAAIPGFVLQSIWTLSSSQRLPFLRGSLTRSKLESPVLPKHEINVSVKNFTEDFEDKETVKRIKRL